MNGIILLVHAPLASAMLDCVSHIYGYTPDNILAVNVNGDDSQANIHKNIQNWMAEKNYQGYLILNDLYGASPFNIAKNFVDKHFSIANINTPLLMLTGLSLPMLMKAICHQNLSVHEMAQKALDGVIQCTSMLQQQLLKDTLVYNIKDEKCTIKHGQYRLAPTYTSKNK
jgi:mannose PTS system EIIA component